jgi:hypothetical protein
VQGSISYALLVLAGQARNQGLHARLQSAQRPNRLGALARFAVLFFRGQVEPEIGFDKSLAGDVEYSNLFVDVAGEEVEFELLNSDRVGI